MHRKDRFLSYKTNRYKLHLYETATGLKILMNTDVSVQNVNEYLHNIYKVCVFALSRSFRTKDVLQGVNAYVLLHC